MHSVSSPWLNIEEVRRYVGGRLSDRCSRKFIYTEVRAGRLRAARVGTMLRFRIDWVDAWMEGSTTAANVPSQADVA